MELKHLENTFVNLNGYNRKQVQRTIRTYTPDQEKRERSNDVLWIPYIPGAESLQRALLSLDIEVAFKRGNTIGKELSRLKRTQPAEDRKDVIYEIPCGQCDSTYIGETGRTLKKRIQEHKQAVRRGDENNGPLDHMIRTAGHRINWEEARIIDSEQNTRRRKIKEAIYIRALDSSRNQEFLMNQDRGREIHPSWDIIMPTIECSMHPTRSQESLAPAPECSLFNMPVRQRC